MSDHEEVLTGCGPRSGLPITVAVHSRRRGPAIGGCRMTTYPDPADGTADALRLSAAMTVKCAVAGVPYGGGKSVIAVPEGVALSPSLRQAALTDLGEVIASLGGSYVVGPDVGTGSEDMLAIRAVTPHVFCVPPSHGGAGSSSGPTADGVLAALRTGARHVFGTDAMAGRTVTVVGLGSVGALLADALAAAGARIVVTDVQPRKRQVARERGFTWVEPADALTHAADVLVPSALGGLLGPDEVDRVRASLVVGPANNQLTDDAVAELLRRRGIVWIPDVVASAGGIIATLAREVEGRTPDEATARVEIIGATVELLLDASRRSGATPLHETTRLARRRLAEPRS